MLTFPEEILLLLHRAEDGSFLPIGTHALKRVLVCSVLMELEFAYRIDTVPAQLTVGDRTPTGNPLLDRALERIAASAEIRDTRAWIETLSATEGDTIRDGTLASLMERGILERRERRVLGLFRSESYRTLDRTAALDTRQRITGVLFSDEIPDPRDIALICLAEACDILRAVFTADEVRRMKPRLDLLRRMDLIGREMITQLATWKLGYGA